jgi:hypothetical protein
MCNFPAAWEAWHRFYAAPNSASTSVNSRIPSLSHSRPLPDRL